MPGLRHSADPALAHLRFEHLRKPRRAKAGRNVTQMHYARQGIITPEMMEVVGGVKTILFGDEDARALVAGPPPGSVEQAYRSPLEQ